MNHHDYVVQVKRALDTLYAWVSEQAPATASPTSYMTSLLHSIGTATSQFQQQLANLGFFSALLESLRHLGRHLVGPFESWQGKDPASLLDNVLWNYTPDIHAFQHRLRFNLEPNSGPYDVDTKVMLLSMLVPLVLLFLIATATMGAGNMATPTHLDDQGPESTAKEIEVERFSKGDDKKEAKKAAKTFKNAAKHNAGFPLQSHQPENKYHSSPWSTMLGSAGFRGVETLDYKPVDIYAVRKKEHNKDTLSKRKQSHITNVNNSNSLTSMLEAHGLVAVKRHDSHLADKNRKQLLSDDKERSDYSAEEGNNSWGSMMGAMGFYGAQALNFEPYHNLAGRDLGRLLDRLDEVGNVGGDAHVAQKTTALDAKDELAERTSSFAQEHKHATNEKLKPMEAISKMAKNATQVTEAKVSKVAGDARQAFEECTRSDDKRTFVSNIAEKQDEQAATRSSKPMRTRTIQPTYSSSFKEGRAGVAAPATATTNIQGHQDLGSKIMGFAQDSQVVKDMDSLTDGLFGITVFTLAALASGAEAAVGMINDSLPNSVTDFAKELKESLDVHAAQTRSESDGQTWGIRQAISQILEEDDKVHSTFKAASNESSADNIHAADVPLPLTKSYAAVVAATPQSSSAATTRGVEITETDDTTTPSPMAIATGLASYASVAAMAPTAHRTTHAEDKDKDGRHDQHKHEQHSSPWVVHPHDEVTHDHKATSAGTTTTATAGADSSTGAFDQEDQSSSLAVQEYTLDEHGNKVAVADVRRDSGFDMLS
ncbi:hypothetical protein EDD11_008246 [Mortierella claussenii]|nr:hypothetical protein EDD11_008246 [Mortierella claussenii]